jgi:hypothetical protein
MARLLWLMSAVLLSACGGGEAVAPVAPVTPPSMLSGVAASGGALAGRVFLKDALCHERFVDTADGRFAFDLAGLSAPFMLKATTSAGASPATFYSFGLSASGGTVNITPLTQLSVAAAAGSIALDAVYDACSAATFASIATALPAVTAQLAHALAPLLALQGVVAIDLITGPFAADHTGLDAVLDSIGIVYAGSRVSIVDQLSGAIVLDAIVVNLAEAATTLGWDATAAAVASDPDVAVATNGDTLVAWSEMVNSQSVVRARFLTDPDGSAIALSTAGDAGLVRVGFDAVANAIAVWTQYENGRNDIWARRYVAASKTWLAPVRLSAPNAVADSNVPDLALDGAGNAFVVWHQGDGRVNHFDVWSARLSAASGAWSAPTLLSDGVASSYNPHVALDAAGDGVAGWEQEQGDGTTVSNAPKDIWALRIQGGSASAATRLNAVGGDVAAVYGQLALALDSHGNGLALWVQGAGAGPFVIHAARLVSGSGWQGDRVITDLALDNSYGPHAAFDAAGNASVVWQQQSGSGALAGVNRFDSALGWGTSTLLGADAAGDVYDPRVAVDGVGNATAVWYQLAGSNATVRSARADPAGAWSASQLLATPPTGFSYPVPRVAANAARWTVAVWGTDSF